MFRQYSKMHCLLSVLLVTLVCSELVITGRPVLADDAQTEKNEQKIYEQAHAGLKEQFDAAREQFDSVNDKFEKFREAMKSWRGAVTRRNQNKSIDDINKLLDGINDEGVKAALEQVLGEDAVKTLEGLEERFGFQLSDHVNLLDAVGKDPRKQWDWMYNLSAFDQRLRERGVYDRLDSVKDMFDRASPHIDRIGQLTEFMKVFDPTAVDQTKPGGTLRAVGGALKYASSLAENVPGIGHLINYYIEATDAFADALDRLDGKLKANRQGALGGQLRDNEGIQQAFAALCPDADFHANMFIEVTDERPALKPAEGETGPRVWEHLEDKRIFLFRDTSRAALLSGPAFGALYEGLAALRHSAIEANRNLLGLDEFVAIVQAASVSGSDPSRFLAEFTDLHRRLCGPDSLQLRRVLAHVGEIPTPFRGDLTAPGPAGEPLRFFILSDDVAEFRGLCLYSVPFRTKVRQLVAEYADQMVVTLVLIPAESGKTVKNPNVQIDGQPVTLKATDQDYEVLLPRRSHFDLRIEAEGFLPVVGKYSFGTGGAVRVVLQTVTPGETTPPDTASPPTDPTGTNPPPNTPVPPPVPTGSVQLAIRGPVEVVGGIDVPLTALVDGVDLNARRLAIVWRSSDQQELARGESCTVKAPDSGAATVVAQVEEPQATGPPRVHAAARHEIKVANVKPQQVEIRCSDQVVPVGRKVSLYGQVTAPGIPWSRLRLEWSHDLGKETAAEFKAATPGTVELRLSVYQRLDAGEVKVAEDTHKLIVVSTALVVPQPLLQGKAFDVGIQPAPQLASQVKYFGWSGGNLFDPATKRWDNWRAEFGPHVTMMYPIHRFAADNNPPSQIQVSVALQDLAKKKLYEAQATSQLQPVALNGAASDIWEGGGADRTFGLTRKDSQAAPRTIDGSTAVTARVGARFHMSQGTVSEETATPDALSAYVRKVAAESNGQQVTAVAVPPFRGFLSLDPEVKYKGGGWSFDAGYRDASAIRTGQAWLINGPSLLTISFHAGGSGRFDNSDEAWLRTKTGAVFEEAVTILGGLRFTPDGRFQHTPYDGPALDGSQDVAPLKLVLDGPAQDVTPGQEVKITANVSGGRAPYSFAWEGDHAGSGATVLVPTLRPGEHRIGVTVTSKDGQSESAALTYRVSGAVGRLTGLPSQVQFGREYTLGVTLPGGLQGARIYWQASPNVEFSQVETAVRASGTAATSSTRVLFDRCPKEGVKLWAQIIDDQGATIGEAEQITVGVQKPTWRTTSTPSDPRVGQSLEIRVTPAWTIREDLFDLAWTTPASNNRQELVDNASRISVVPRDSSPVKLQAEVVVPQVGDDLGRIAQTLSIKVASYEVVASIVDSGPTPKVWKTGTGLVDVPRGTYLTDQRVLLQAQIPGYPKPAVVRWKWLPNEGTSLTNPGARYPTATRHEPGTASLTVIATDPDGIELGRGTVTFQVIPQSVDVVPGSGDATIADTSIAPGSPGSLDTGGTPDSTAMQVKQLAAAALAQAARGDIEAALASVKRLRELDSGQAFATADTIAELLWPQVDQAREAWDFERSGELSHWLRELLPGNGRAIGGVVQATADTKYKREVEAWRRDAFGALDRGDWDRAEERLKSIRLWEDIMPATPRPETQALAARYETERAAYEAAFRDFQKDVAADQAARRIDEAHQKLTKRLQQGGLTQHHRNWINGMLVAGEELGNLPPPRVTPLQKPWQHVAQIDTLWSLDAGGLLGTMGLTYYPDRLEGWVDLGQGREPLAGLNYIESTSRIAFARTTVGQHFTGLVNGSRMQGSIGGSAEAATTETADTAIPWVARLKSTTGRVETGRPADQDKLATAWTHQPPAVAVQPATIGGRPTSGTLTAIPGTSPGEVMTPSPGQSGRPTTTPPDSTGKPPVSVTPGTTGTQPPSGVEPSGSESGVRILVSSDATIEKPVTPAGTEGPTTLKAGQVLTRVSGEWESREYRQEPQQFGVFEVSTAGRLRAEIDTTPHAKPVWSLWNADTGLVVTFEPKRGSGYGPPVNVAAATGLIEQQDNKPLVAEGTWPGPGRLTVFCPAPGGSGPLTGSQFAQAFKGVVEIIEVSTTVSATAGQTLQTGDRIRTGGQGGVVLAGPGTRYQVGANTDIAVETLDQRGRLKDIELHAGSLRVSEQGTSPQPTQVRVSLPDGPTFTVKPEGTDYEVIHQGKTARVVVYSGSVNVTGPDGRDIPVAAGQSLLLPAIEFAPVDTSKDQGLGIGGLPADELPFDDETPEPPGAVTLTVANGKPGNNWIWQDPGNDASLTRGADGAVLVSVPDGNEFWDYVGTSPRLLHKVTGDFDLSGEMLLKSPGNHLAISEFVVYSPGSYIGEHAKQMRDWLLVHYRLIGGGWTRLENQNVLRLFQRPLRDGVPAPDGPVHVRMTRRGNVFRTYWSLDGQDWRLSSHAEMNVGPTIWPGLVFKRVAHDGQRQEPAITTLSNVVLKSGDDLDASDWSGLLARGRVSRSGDEFSLALGQDEQDRVSAISTQSLEGDLDVIVRYEIPEWEHQPGQDRRVGIMLSTLDDPESRAVYIDLYQHDSTAGPLVRSDTMLDRQWRRYRTVGLTQPPSSGWLRITRRADRCTTLYWAEGEWNVLEQSEIELPDTVWLWLNIANDHQAPNAASLQATFQVERLLSGPEATNAEDWQPAGVGVLAEIAPPQLTLPRGVQARQWQAPFGLGRVFFDQQDNAYVFSSAKDRDKLVRITSDGVTSTVRRGEPFAGLNYKTAVWDGEDLLVTIDYWHEGGTALSGLFRVKPDG
jgi:hypothetical protein